MKRQRVALITGASRGIGRAIAEQLAGEGFDLTISARNPETLDQVAAQLRGSGRTIIACPADLSVQHETEMLAENHLLNFESLDLLILNAGIGYSGELCSFPLRKFDRQMEVNVRSPLLLIQSLLPALRATARLEPDIGTKIVAISSITGMVGELDLAAYGATKAALISLCESVIVAESDRGVSATSISPGYVDTNMTEWMNDRIPADTMIRAHDIAILVSAISRLSRNAVVPNIAVTRPGKQIWRA